MQAHVLRKQLDAEKVEGEQQSALAVPTSQPASLPLLTNDFVFEHPSRTCSVQMRIRISSRVRLGTRAALPDSEYHGPIRQPAHPVPFRIAAACTPVVYEMLRDYQHCTTRNAMHSATTKPLLAHLMRSTPRTSPHQALPFLHACAALIDPTGAKMIFSGVTPQRSPPVRLHAPKLGCATPPPCATPAASTPHRICRFPRLPPPTAILGAAPLCPSTPAPLAQPQLPSAPPPLCAALMVAVLHRRRRVFLLPAHYDHRSIAPLPPRYTIDTRSATGMRRRLKHQEAIVVLPATSLSDEATRDVPPRRSYPHVRHVAPPTAFLPPRQSPPRWSVACVIRRDYQLRRLSQGTVYSTITPRAISHATMNPLHAARDVRRDRHVTTCRDPHPQCVTLASVVPHADFVASPRCATVLTSVPPSPLEARPCRALQYHPQHVLRPQRAPRSFLIAGAAFVAFSYATTIYCPHRSTRAVGRIPNMPPTSPAPAAAALHRARRGRRLPYDAHHHQRTQHTVQLSPIPRTTFVPSPRAPTICSSPTPPACRRHSPPSALYPSHPNTAPILSAVPPPDIRASYIVAPTREPHTRNKRRIRRCLRACGMRIVW
ncbi:hypothetical protein DFH09DRAFT_1313622 [Mycena vulgaris]|nr:hypothetical protein DFH09DRAFT_1313622 [Mycena vulgaris]